MSRTLGKRTAPSSRGRVVTGPTLSPGLPGQGIYIPVSISWGESVHSCQALIDSGAAGNFMDIHFAQSINIPTAPLEVPLSVSALDGQALGDGRVTQVTSPVFLQSQGHKEEISLHLIPSPEFPVILGLPWLTRHNPRIDWVTSQVVEWGPACHASCLLSSSPVSPAEPPDLTELSQVPTEYWDLKEVFSKSRAAVLPPHRAYDCAIDLLPGTTPPRGRLFSLSQPERKAMEEYLKDALVSGFIRPSTSPAGAGFFFVGKKDGGLRPCIDYRGLNKITVRNRYPLPLMSTAFDLLQGATVFTKLDLRNAYHLIRIRQGDEWKTAFNTPSGHYEYQVMPFGLTNAPAVFQALINDVLRDMINLDVFVYLDDILIFSKTVQEHRHHVRQVLQRLLQNNLFAKAQKCEFHVPEVSFLGFIVRTDVASRGLKADVFLRSETWLSGPAYLLHPEQDWPVSPDCLGELLPNDPEVKVSVAVNAVQTSEDVDATTRLIHYFSSWTHLRKAVAWVIRLKNLLRCLSQRRKWSDAASIQFDSWEQQRSSSEQENGVFKDLALRGLLTVDELLYAEKEIIRFCQRKRFPDELSSLQSGRNVKKNSYIFKLSPVLENGCRPMNNPGELRLDRGTSDEDEAESSGELTTRPPEADEDEPEDVPQNSEATTASEACQAKRQRKGRKTQVMEALDKGLDRLCQQDNAYEWERLQWEKEVERRRLELENRRLEFDIQRMEADECRARENREFMLQLFQVLRPPAPAPFPYMLPHMPPQQHPLQPPQQGTMEPYPTAPGPPAPAAHQVPYYDTPKRQFTYAPSLRFDV
ncbi:uncharacterized protein LOC132899074 [Neoarius graeffei]|uniref:uncharacterized protein LOC132899074 n=1 Tax=Neoarius graeffei TaxID=443677 RepID=UPI00298D10EB|nr:uncharacterized protein LOC132899074 [Neoarius graeffei]